MPAFRTPLFPGLSVRADTMGAGSFSAQLFSFQGSAGLHPAAGGEPSGVEANLAPMPRDPSSASGSPRRPLGRSALYGRSKAAGHTGQGDQLARCADTRCPNETAGAGPAGCRDPIRCEQPSTGSAGQCARAAGPQGCRAGAASRDETRARARAKHPSTARAGWRYGTLRLSLERLNEERNMLR